ncbi:Serine/threonine protein kinase [Rhizoclosmatium globosum]|uniref:non-specific serine/threonine protein kinase n=1 Tax=Rhizoclosmatium globosum TaxID=329046 RepID=A0A1Y2BNI3_9FUNG|nr:TP53 regulating kinase [Rhizoclosmatium hyalinum]KAJ3287564.1 TP53 regulating kinase [Rhizoclosmatium sp. JEL0117]ORY36318.1 Serine/threonine protein kinase [Rhizoclosmatium globosum]|eukprot:ORY36318.1 Serine/threonine protein kinase [Rhizoclosmatium globosum]
MTLLSQGAEARVFKTSFGLKEVCIVKERFRKTYRHPVLDEKLSKRRTILEARCLVRAKKCGIDAPAVYLVDPVKSLIYMEFVEGETMKAFFNRELNDHAKRNEISTKIGTSLAKLHNADVVHGDLTTSNMMLRAGTESVVFIDFGLSFVSNLTEDKAVDLYVLERALASTHPQSHVLLDAILASYFKDVKDSKQVLKKLEDVRLRGRKRDQTG